MKRKMTLEQVRAIVLSRLTKGEAFIRGDDYAATCEAVKAMLATMTVEEIKRRWPHHTYDVK